MRHLQTNRNRAARTTSRNAHPRTPFRSALSALAVGSMALTTVFFSAASAVAGGGEWPQYQSGKPLTGELRSVGSDAMGGLMDLWTEGFHKHQPGVTVFHASRGSASAPSALLDGSANLGPMARPMKSTEVDSLRARFGVEPTQVRVALSGIAIYVSKSNPISQLSLKELDAIFSEPRKRGGAPVRTWGDLGVTGAFAATPIMPVGQIESSYAHTFFKQQVLMQGAYKSGLEATANTLSALDTIAANPGAIGFGEVEVAGEGVRVLPISRNIGTKATLPTRENLLTEEYPLSRFLSVYLVKLPNQELDEVSKNFLSFVLSHEGQTLVKKEGLLPLPAAVAKEELSKLGQ